MNSDPTHQDPSSAVPLSPHPSNHEATLRDKVEGSRFTSQSTQRYNQSDVHSNSPDIKTLQLNKREVMALKTQGPQDARHFEPHPAKGQSPQSGELVKREEKGVITNEFQQTTGQKESMGSRTSKMMLDGEGKNYAKLNFKKPLVYEGEILVACKYYSFDMRLVHISCCESILIEEKQLRTRDLLKINILPVTVQTKHFKIQLFAKAGKYAFGVELRRELYLLPEHYLWFAKIVNVKMASKGFDLSVPPQQAEELGWTSTFCKGQLYKRSKHLKKWSQRYIVITNEGLFSYRNRNENYSIFISMKDMTELSTDFQIYDNHLVIILQCSKSKLEFAIPIHDFCLKTESNWLFAFYRLLMEHKYHIKIV